MISKRKTRVFRIAQDTTYETLLAMANAWSASDKRIVFKGERKFLFGGRILEDGSFKVPPDFNSFSIHRFIVAGKPIGWVTFREGETPRVMGVQTQPGDRFYVERLPVVATDGVLVGLDKRRCWEFRNIAFRKAHKEQP